ncbi:iron-containing alcohol dehydrogenase, partial [Acinetobacter baumannii]
MAFNSAGLGLVHALAHQPGATHNLPHGVCNAILLPIIENFNRPHAVARFARVAPAMGVDTRGMSDEAASMEAINAIRALSKRVGIPQGFSQLGVSKADIEGWLDKALADRQAKIDAAANKKVDVITNPETTAASPDMAIPFGLKFSGYARYGAHFQTGDQKYVGVDGSYNG